MFLLLMTKLDTLVKMLWCLIKSTCHEEGKTKVQNTSYVNDWQLVGVYTVYIDFYELCYN